MPNMHSEKQIHQYKPSKIIGVQFSILSPEEIRRASVAEITTRDTYVNNKPVIGGLFDPRMGVLEPGLVCPTDGLDYIQTPGYFGHIELAKPVYYIQYLNTVMKVLRCVCFKCSKILLNKEKYIHALNMKPEQRWNYVFQLASKIKRCGQETDDGCGCKQPDKFKKEGLATIHAEWDDKTKNSDGEKLTMVVTPEVALKILRRISDEDVDFMGFSPTWSRPDWMICQVFAVPPPAMRPSVKHDAQQRSEDDITHINVNIIKTNKVLQERIQQNAAPNVIEDWTTLLQYYIATQVDNKIPGVASVAQRSGRPLKSIKERLNGKTGRVRGNLMGKRVDFSARSVITADPNISIRELGVPLSVAKNITKPVIVNERNRQFLSKLVENGPDNWPGAKILEKKHGHSISLRHAKNNNIHLENGDVVHRHMMDGDAILFNRQPTLHRMSMMSHIVRVMKNGNTFRMNVADTKPYNADFDGDEMNLHMPQDMESESELRNLAAVPYQLVSPANNSPIVGIFQDSLLGAHRFTRQHIQFSHRDAMNLLMNVRNVSMGQFKKDENITSNELLSQILPPLSLRYKTNLFKEDTEDMKTSPNVLEIQNGKYIRGLMEKSVLGSSTKGLLHRICNDFGNMTASQFVDDLQNIITDYLKTSSYSVGISDLVANETTNQKIIEVITDKKVEVKNLIHETHMGLFENDTGKKNMEHFEMRVNNILNKASSQAGQIGRNSLGKDNRFVIMVNAGSKGSELNISQMISCLGQQNVNGKRIPYGFHGRTLPHYSKYDDTPAARGFVESSYIAGLRPEELFFHAMGGRVGLIDTAVKTSQTGYIQRRLIKGLEDLKVEYDMTVRNNMGKIVQYSYGDDGFDTVRVETQILPFIEYSIEEIYLHYYVPTKKARGEFQPFTKPTLAKMRKQDGEYKQVADKYSTLLLETRDEIVKHIYHYQKDKRVNTPVGFTYIIQNIQHQCNAGETSMVDITPLDAMKLIETTFEKLKMLGYCAPNRLFEILYFYHLSPKVLLQMKRFNKVSLHMLLETITTAYKRSIVAPGEMVGMIAAQSIGEPTTQMTLNTFHFAGVASKSNVTRGVPRIEEILSLTDNPKNPSLTIYLREEDEQDKTKAQTIMYMIEHTKLEDIIDKVQICFDPKETTTRIEQDTQLLEQYYAFENMVNECADEETGENAEADKSKWVVRLSMNAEIMLEKNITMDDVHFTLTNIYSNDIQCVYSDYNDDNLVFRIRMTNVNKKDAKSNKKEAKSLDQTDEMYLLRNFQNNLLQNVVLRGVKNIGKVLMRKVQNNVKKVEGSFKSYEHWVLDTIGNNLVDVLALDYIDVNRTFSNNILEMYNVLGIEAARQSIYNELVDVIAFDDTYINTHHLDLLCDRMTYNTKMTSIFRHGINNDHIGPIAKAAFEETPEMFLRAARHGEVDLMKGVSANIMCGQEGYFGTSAFQVLIDGTHLRNVQDIEDDDDENTTSNKKIMKDDGCSIPDLHIENNAKHIKAKAQTQMDDDYMPDF